MAGLDALVDRAREAVESAADDPERAAAYLAQRCLPRLIRHPDGRPYLSRFYLIGAPLTPKPFTATGRPRRGIKWPNIDHGLYLHHFHSSDVEQFHNHPWVEAQGLMLHGGYLEHRPGRPSRPVKPGDSTHLKRDTFHRVELIGPDAWTVFAVGEFAGDWTRVPPGGQAMKKPHHTGTYDKASRAVVAAAYANPGTQCWRCGRILTQHSPTKTGNPPRWSAGHVVDGQINGELRPEVLSCNSRAGARLGNAQRRPRTALSW